MKNKDKCKTCKHFSFRQMIESCYSYIGEIPCLDCKCYIILKDNYEKDERVDPKYELGEKVKLIGRIISITESYNELDGFIYSVAVQGTTINTMQIGGSIDIIERAINLDKLPDIYSETT